MENPWCLLCTILTCPTAGIKTGLKELNVQGTDAYLEAGNVLLTIHRMEPVGCSTCWDPLHRDLTVARPKSPIFTVRPSWRNISGVLLKKLPKKIEPTVLCCLTWPASAACFIWNKGKGILWQPCFNEHLTLNQSRCCSCICGFIFMVSWDRNQQFIAIHGCLNNWEGEIAQSSHNSERKILKKQLQGQVSTKIKSISITFSGRSPEI